MPTFDELRNQFDSLSIDRKYEYVNKLKDFVKTSSKPEHRAFLLECAQKYNAEVDALASSNSSSVNAVNTETDSTGDTQTQGATLNTKAKSAGSKRNRTNKLAIFNLFIGLLLGTLLVLNFYISNVRSELLPPNASVCGVDIGSLTVEEAKDRVLSANSDYSILVRDSFTQMVLVFGNNINLRLDYEVAVDEIYRRKSDIWIFDLWKDYVSNTETILRFDNRLLARFTEDFVSAWNTVTEKPADAYIILGEDCFEIAYEEEGKLLNAQSVYDVLHSAVSDGAITVDLSSCKVPFEGRRADDLSDILPYFNTFAGFKLEYVTGDVLDFKFLVENEWLVFGSPEVRLAEHKVIEYVVGLGNAYDTDDLVLDKASEAVQLISDINNKQPVSRSMIFREASENHNPINLLRHSEVTEQISLPVFLDELEITFDEYIAFVAELENQIYPHYLSGNAFRYADYWSYNPDMSASTVFALVNVNADIEPYTGISEVYEPYSMWVLVNKHYQFTADYAPDDLTGVSGSWLMRAEAAMAFNDMRSDMRGQGLTVYVTSAYRSYQRQDEIYRGRVRSYGIEQADKEAARAGHSKHNAGLAIDFFHRSDVGRAQNANFQNTAHFGWLTRYAHYYGYILRYPEEYINVHRNIFEPWHWRYVGVEIATAMYEKEIALYEEFYGKYLAPEVLYTVKQIILEQREQGDVIDFEQYMQKAKAT